MINSFGDGINGFRNSNACLSNDDFLNQNAQMPAVSIIPGPPRPCPMSGIYGSLYNIGPERITVVFPGNVVPILFSNNALLGKGIVHVPGSAEVMVCCPGNYEISFTVYFTASSAAFGTFAIQRNGVNLPGGVFSKMLSTNYQIYTGTTMAFLSGGDVIRLSFTAPQAIDVTLTGNDVTAVLSIKRLN